jgi:CheY-like chemotaxis protein
MKKILIIEDDKQKIERLLLFFSDKEVVHKESFQSGLQELKKSHQEFDLLILDMTIPLWEKGKNDLGGNYEQFGGERILREMKRRKLFLPTILFTMFDIFPNKGGSITFSEMNTYFKKDFEEFYIGAVYYNSTEENWKTEMIKLISSISNE